MNRARVHPGMLIGLALLVASCRTITTERPTAVPAPVPAPVQHRSPEPAPPVADAGPPLELELPLAGGGSLPLSALRGRMVLLELASPSSPPDEAAARWRALQRELGAAAMAVVVVSAEVGVLAPERLHDGESPPFVLAWDPEGALALRLGVTRWPTRLVLDREGRVLTAETGTGAAALARIERVLREAA